MNEEMVENTQNTENNYSEYLEAIKTLKSTTVNKAEYEALKEERNTLLSNLVNGQYVSTETETQQEPADIKELRKQLFKPDHELNDIEYVTKALELRNAVLEQTGEDCFVGKSHSLTPTQDDYNKAQRVADIFQECLDNCGGNNGKFIAELQSRMNDTFIPLRKK